MIHSEKLLIRYCVLGIIALALVCYSQVFVWASDSSVVVPMGKERESRVCSGNYGGPDEASEMVIMTQKGWKGLWTWLEEEPLASLRFDDSKDMAVAIFLGTRLTGGYRIVLLSVKEEAGVYVVNYMESEPGGLVTQALTTPYMITLLPKTDKKVTFKKWDHRLIYLANELEKRQMSHVLSEVLAGVVDSSIGCILETMEDIDPEVVNALIEALKVPDNDIRINAVWALGKIGSQARAAVPELMEALEDKDWKVRFPAAWTLGRIGPDAVETIPSLIHALGDRNVDVRREAVQALGWIRPQANEVVPALIGSLKAPDADIRFKAALTLGEFGSMAKTAVPALIDALDDPDELVRRFAPQALGGIGPDAKDAVPALILGFKDEEVSTYAPSALGKIGKVAVPALIEALKDEDQNVRNKSASALGYIGQDAKTAVPALIRLAKEQEQTGSGRHAEMALYEIENALSEAKNSDVEKTEVSKQLVKMNPDDAEAHNKLGDTYYKSGMYKEAIGAFKQAISINPDYADAHYNLGVVYGKSGMHKEAVEVYKQAININPDYVNTSGLAYGRSGLRETAIATLNQAIRIDPDFAEAYCSIGKYYYHNIKDYKKAFNNLNKATELYISISFDMASDNIAETSALLDMLDDKEIAKRMYELELKRLEDYLEREKNIIR